MQGNTYSKSALPGRWHLPSYGLAARWMPHSLHHEGAMEGWTAAAREWGAPSELLGGNLGRPNRNLVSRILTTLLSSFIWRAKKTGRNKNNHSLSFLVCPEVTLLLHFLFLTFRQSIVSCSRHVREFPFTWMKIRKNKFLLYGTGDFLLTFF